MCFDDFSERHYHNMNENQRKQFFEHVQKQPSFSLENEQCRHFFARFNPKNQYLVSCFHNGKADEIRCYRFNDKFHTSKNRSVNPEYIKTYISEYSE
jgi:6-phosphogluconolactonase (cycloisomerase 2 family)